MKLFFVILTNILSLQLLGGGKDDSNLEIPNSITLTILNIIHPTCQKYNGKVIVQATGGIAPYAYTISGPFAPQPSGVFFNLPPGTYTVTATDALNNVGTQNVTLTNNLLAPTAHSVGFTAPSGCNTFDATFTMSGSGGLQPYTYSLDNINYQTSNVFTNLTAGDYNYVVKDANGCTSIPAVLFNPVIHIPVHCPFTIINGIGGSLSCNPKSATLNVGTPLDGTPPFTYSSDGVNYQTSNVFPNLADGIYTFWIKDATGLILLYSCSYLDNCPAAFFVNNLTLPAHCGQNGSITVNASNGTPPYLYSLDGINYQSSNQFTGLVPGVYTVSVKDFYNLIVTRLANVVNNCAVVNTTITNTTCGNNNGKIEAHGSNGTAPYLFSMDGINYSANYIFSNLLAGNYIVYIKDATGAVGSANVVISNIAGPKITSINSTESGCDNRSGVINVNTSSGTSPIVYSINATTFQSSSTFNGLAPGNYNVTIKDNNNCIDAMQATVLPSSNMPVVNLGKDTALCEDQKLTLNAAYPGSSYIWQDGSTQATFLVTDKGKYYVSVNNLGCIAKDTINVDYDLKPHFTLGEDKRLCPGNSFILKPAFTNNVSLQGLRYLWQDGSVQPTFNAIADGLYRLEIGNFCGTASDELIIVKGICDLYIPNSFTPNGDNKNDIFRVGYGDNVLEFEMRIFNRYGQLIFKTKDKNKGWDGKVNGLLQQQGVYTWIIKYKTVTGSSWQSLQNTVILLR